MSPLLSFQPHASDLGRVSVSGWQLAGEARGEISGGGWGATGRGRWGCLLTPATPPSQPGFRASLLSPEVPSSGPQMKALYRKLSLVAACMLMLWLTAFFLGWESSQKGLSEKARMHPRACKCPSDTFRKCTCASKIRKCSPCLHTAGDSAWFDRSFERAIEPLLSEEPMSPDALILWLVSAQSWSLSNPSP